jgi:hypothetical protein
MVATVRGLGAFLLVAAITYLLTEGALSIAMALGWFAPNLDGAYYTQPPVTFDNVRGYRWHGPALATARVARGQFVYGPVTLPIDARGYIGAPTGFASPRIAVLGDSYTDASYLERSWPMQTAQTMRADVVNFAVDGGGIVNWRSVFFGEIVTDPRGFDGLIIAVYLDDLARGFFAETSDSFFLYGHHYESPAAADAQRADLNCPLGFIVSPDYLKWLIDAAHGQHGFGLNTVRLVSHYASAALQDYRFRREGPCAATDFYFTAPQFGTGAEVMCPRNMRVTCTSSWKRTSSLLKPAPSVGALLVSKISAEKKSATFAPVPIPF